MLCDIVESWLCVDADQIRQNLTDTHTHNLLNSLGGVNIFQHPYMDLSARRLEHNDSLEAR